MESETLIFISSAILLAFMVGAILFIIFGAKKTKAECKRLDNELAEKTFEKTEFHATVIDMRCQVNTVGHKMPKTVKTFEIAFRDDEGNTQVISVPEEYYAAFEKDSAGILTLVDGEFYSFEIDN